MCTLTCVKGQSLEEYPVLETHRPGRAISVLAEASGYSRPLSGLPSPHSLVRGRGK